ncbi:hypothetical protein NQZ79_g6322 [Umbelopsis isabellina]|nr:hypothetical protein NQZ79_g6322 [Umbelopsis isabellina]
MSEADVTALQGECFFSPSPAHKKPKLGQPGPLANPRNHVVPHFFSPLPTLPGILRSRSILAGVFLSKKYAVQSEWAKFVSPALVQKYNEFNRPYRPFSRFCQDCDSELVACRQNRAGGLCRENRFQSIRQSIDIALDMCASPCLPPTTSTVAIVKEMHHYVTSAVLACIESRAQHSCSTCQPLDVASAKYIAADISLQFVSMEISPESWKSLQFAHIALFPDVECSTCSHSTCLRCGEFSHPDTSCHDNLQRELKNKESSEELESIRWKFENSRSCPSCSIMIHRDEGCNKVDCSLCGYRFCWACLSAWSEKCGFYQCGYQPDDELAAAVAAGDVALEAKAELGVPDVLTIERRYSLTSTK